jgi:hypothetical protein
VSKSTEQTYWASVPTNEIADEIIDRVDKYFEFLSYTGRLNLYRRSYAYYYRPRITGAQLNPTGEQGELTAFSVNHYRNLLLHLETMTTQQRPYFEARATNSDVKSQAQTILAGGLLDYYYGEKKLERNIKQAVKDGLIFGEGFICAEWDPSSGEKYGKTETGADVYNGDMKYTNYMPLNVCRDFTKQAANQDDWFIVRDFMNKYDLAAKYPDIAKEILEDSIDMLQVVATTTLNKLALAESDNVVVYRLFHRPTSAMPQGRYVTCLDNGTVMLDGPFPYKSMNIFRLAPDEETGTCFGFTVGYDLLSVQEAIDILYSTVISNQSSFGVQNVLVPKGHDISTSQMAGGLNVVEYDPKIGKPEAMNLTNTPAEIFNFIQMLETVAETISGVNSVARGNPEASLKSGAALALVQSMAIQFSMNLQQSYAQLLEDTGLGTVEILQQFASTPRVAMITGKSNRPLLKYFKSEDIAEINRVTVDMGNPLTRTTAGKVNLADALLQNQMVDNPDQYIQVATTGRLEPIIQGKQSEMLLIKAENENLAEGIEQPVIATDQHAQHVLEHKTVLASPEARQDPAIVNATLNHIFEHIQALQTVDPALLQLIHQQALPPPAPAPGMAMQMNPQQPAMAAAEQVNMPNAPQPPAGTDPQSQEVIAQQGAQVQQNVANIPQG